ncbi:MULTISPECIES: TolC family protein [Betaproteobacteria]|jgi:cobalt-zinc-cadmium efflux system outer membrane protein|uniref:TolC family protein n=1 Tax=Methylotenera oryzisoli TaxID=2080758 RepID=A0A4Y9VT68_9PROT|nr:MULTISPECIES: TolC family protein [Betaproteobacteria]PKO47580.1 MAG: TolC family protein [Betaproteobacteria bacterium HGW-Betaproteobacteria-22]MDD2934006.1 TolC family protein [Methylotenera sp.]MDD4925306.1 TolC family protein [Methylotenera sp.]MDP1958972.1 TolC family protein [Methylotenera sp.]MDP3777773.1 TolC family protein [Methylotenera sp.]
MRLCYLFLSFILLSIPVLAANDAALQHAENQNLTDLSLSDSLDLALKANPDIAVAIREREAIDGVKVQAATRPNPFVSTSIQDTRSATRQIYLQFNQEIELGDKRTARMEAADAFYSKADAELATKKAEIHANVVLAFYELLVAQERVTLAKSSVVVAESALDAASKRVKAGKSSPVEQTKSTVAAASAKIELVQAMTQLNNSRKRLSALWGDNAPSFERATGEVATIPEISSLSNLQSLIDSAPSVKLAKLEIDARKAMTRIERSRAIPNITISAGVVNNQEIGLNQALFGLSIPIPVFDRNQGNVQEAASRTFKAEDELIAVKNRIQTNLATQYERLNAARQATLSLQSDILPNAQSAFDAANRGFSLGKFNFLDVLDAQRTLYQAKSQYINALLEAHQSIAEIERTLGEVVEHQATKP